MRSIFSPAGLLVLLLSLVPLAHAGRDDEQIVAEFKRYFREYKDTATRVEAVLSLLDCESPSVVDALIPVFKTEEAEVVRSAVRVLGSFKTRPPVDTMLARLESDKTESVRVGLLRSIAEGHYPDVGASLSVLLTDKVWDVRRRAVQALAAIGDPSFAPAIAPLCDDTEPAVACAALEGLAALKSPLVVEPAIRRLEDPVWQVRASAIVALKQVRRREAVEPLINRLSVEEGRLVVDIGDALGEITGRFFGQRVDAWQSFWAAYKDKFEIPTDEELAKRRQAAKESNEQYRPKKQTTYHNIETPSRKILFVIDVSGSMENLVVEEERFADGGYPSMLRIDIVKTELQRTIEGLEPYVEFNILAFATDVKFWSKELVKANVVKKSSAKDWVGNLEAVGGASKEDLARVGLVGSANLEAGKTNTYGALAAALGIDTEKKREDYEIAVDTIFFLSDGRPSVGTYVDPDDILREIKAANELRKVVIHTIAIGEFQKDFMKRLAEENGGVFVDLGR